MSHHSFFTRKPHRRTNTTYKARQQPLQNSLTLLLLVILSLSTMNPTALSNKDKVAKPYNNYNIFFILERELLLQARASGSPSPPSPISSGAIIDFMGYDNISLPQLPLRYKTLQATLSPNWYVAGKKKLEKRKHKKSHGVATFKEIPRIVAANWRAIDPITKSYIDIVVALLKERWNSIPAHLKQVPLKKVGRPKKVKAATIAPSAEPVIAAAAASAASSAARRNSIHEQQQMEILKIAPTQYEGAGWAPLPSSTSSSATTVNSEIDAFMKHQIDGLRSLGSTPVPEEPIKNTIDDDCCNLKCDITGMDGLRSLGPTPEHIKNDEAESEEQNVIDACLMKRVNSFHSLQSLPAAVNEQEAFDELLLEHGPRGNNGVASPAPSPPPEAIPSARSGANGIICGGNVSEYAEADISDIDILRLYFTP